MSIGQVVTRVIRPIGKIVVDNSTNILTGFAVAGVVATSVYAVEGAIEAGDMLRAHEMDDELFVEKTEITVVDGEEEIYNVSYYRERTRKEAIALTWRCYVKACLTGTATIMCIIGANSISTKRNAALAAAYSLSEEARKEFRDKVVENIGEKKVEKIDNALIQDKVDSHQLPDEDCIVRTGLGDQIMYDSFCGRYIKASRTMVERQINYLQKTLNNNKDHVTVNDFYELLNLGYVPMGDKFGWIYTDDPTIADVADNIKLIAAYAPNQEPINAISFVDGGLSLI